MEKLSGNSIGVADHSNGPHFGIFSFLTKFFLISQKCHFSNSNHLNVKTIYLIIKINYQIKLPFNIYIFVN
ncbi:hypothetical protein CsatB_026364 [Cannabis sativa]